MPKLCECGCGQIAPIATTTKLKFGWIKGQPKRFICGHNKWKGGKSKSGDGRYELTYMPEHPKASNWGYVFTHVLMAENALGTYLPFGTEVHHYDTKQIVICQDKGYHMLLHRRTRALKACGHVAWRKCKVCKTYDDASNLTISRTAGTYHQSCANKLNREKYADRKGTVRSWKKRRDVFDKSRAIGKVP
jgi:hypothetical protein